MSRYTKGRVFLAVVVLIVSLGAFGGAASASHFTDCPRARVCLWDGTNYKGDRPSFGAKSDVIYNLSGFNDRASSVKVNTCCRDVTLATGPNLQGDTLCLDAEDSVANLGNTVIGSNTVSSLMVHESPADECPEV